MGKNKGVAKALYFSLEKIDYNSSNIILHRYPTNAKGIGIRSGLIDKLRKYSIICIEEFLRIVYSLYTLNLTLYPIPIILYRKSIKY